MRFPSAVANAFRMTDEVWRRHANPWSVVTRFAAIPAMALAIWSRVWLGWWALAATSHSVDPVHGTNHPLVLV